MKVGLDLDSCMSMFLESTLNKYNFIYDDNVRSIDIKEWNLDKFLKCTRQQMYDLWTPKFIASVPVRYGAKQMIDELKSMGHSVYIITSYFRTRCEEKVKWCEKYLGLDEENIIFCRHKYMVNVDLLLDDYLKNFTDKYGIPVDGLEKVVMDAPYNQNSGYLGWHYRIKELSELIDIVKLIDKQNK